ncbi:hypothetical protein [Streptomyces morookaense]|uniref:Uncharacterized protein n=1 Tax=Streptomyces morookaense TaxID=1970 RepID=A0A7Y7BAZ3_STRMO|nr:hypothetical protein [Streptomyces morookaense]NVK81806.1 hypothetical protein [Streptomyces morookaense]
MARQQPRKTSREPKGPGARSGRESQARERSVPGTASAQEGYRTEGGTARDQALEGVRARGGRAEKERTRGEAHGKRTQS